MAKTAYLPRVGQRVYKCYRPTNPGVIREVIPQETIQTPAGQTHTPTPHVRVFWLDGTVTTGSSLGLMDFDALIDDHHKKLDTHRLNRIRLNVLSGTTVERETRW
jgi:hypothetical protein